MPLALTGLAAANQLAFFCGAEEQPVFTKRFNITAHVRSLRDIINLSNANAQFVEEFYKDDPEYLDYLKSNDGQDTLFMFLVKNEVNKIQNIQPDAAHYDFSNEPSRAEFYKEKEKCDRDFEDQQIINGIIVAMRELSVSIYGYNESDPDSNEIIADCDDFRRAFNTLIADGRSEMTAYNELEAMSVEGRIATVNDFVTLFTTYAALHQDDSYFFNSLGKELTIFGVYASQKDAEIAENIDTGNLPDVPINEPKVIRL